MATATTDEQITERAPHPEVWSWGEDGRTIYQRLCDILAELPAIGKDQRNEQQKFMYRGHDDVMNALNPLLAKHGVFFSPKVLKRVSGERQTGRGSTMYEVNLCVLYTFYGANGDTVEASAWGEGTDMGDKSTNKAMTMALKNVLAQVFAISTAELSDADAGSPEETSRGAGTPQQRTQDRPQRETREGAFDPAKNLLPGAPRGEDYADVLRERQKLMDGRLDWSLMLQLAAEKTLGEADKAKWTQAQTAEFRYRWSNMITNAWQGAMAHDEFHPELGFREDEADPVVAAAFKFAFGVDFDLPLPRRSQSEGKVGTGDEASESVAGPETVNEGAGEAA